MESVRLKGEGICKTFGSTLALESVDLSLKVGEIRALVGENGAGKSTLAKILSGVLGLDAGNLYVDDKPYRPHDPRGAFKHGVVIVHQEPTLVPHLKVFENIFLGVELAWKGCLLKSKMRSRAELVLGKLGHNEIDVESKLSSLSPATCQIVEIARALILKTRVLILDEPASSLSGPDKTVLFKLLKNLSEQGLSIIYISHFLEEVWNVADTYTVLRDGKSVKQGMVSQASLDGIVGAMVGHERNVRFTRTRQSPGEPILKVKALSGRVRPCSADLTLHRGEVLGIAGLMGSGRTELLRIMFGLDPIRSGDVFIRNTEGWFSPSDRMRQGVGYVSEDRQGEGLATSMSLCDNLTLSHHSSFVSRNALYQDCRSIIKKVGIVSAGPQQRVFELSGGNQQKLALARLLYHDAELLLLDEPTRGIDVGSKFQIYGIIDSLVAQGKAAILISSYFPELLAVADRIAVMSRGCLGPAKPVETLNEEILMREMVV